MTTPYGMATFGLGGRRIHFASVSAAPGVGPCDDCVVILDSRGPMQITPTRVALGVLVTALIATAVWWTQAPASMVVSKATTAAIPVSKDTTATTPVAKLTRPKRPATRAATAALDVGTDYWAASDWFDFVQRNAPQALTDNRVAFWVGIAARTCWATVELHRGAPATPYPDLEKCRGFLDGDAFAAARGRL